MAQNLVSITFSDEEITQLRAHVAGLTAMLGPKTLALDADKRRALFKMGERSEVFVRGTVNGLDRNRQVVPPSLDLDGALADVRALDTLRPLRRDLEQLVERLRDTETALGSDLMETAVEGYSLLKVSGRNQGLDGLVKDLGTRFTRGPRKAEPATPAAEPAGAWSA